MLVTWSWEINGDCVEKSGNVYLFSTHKLCFTSNQGCTSCSLLNLVMAKRLPGWAGFEIWHFKMPEEAISGAVVSVAVEAPGLKGSWCTELRLGTIQKYGERQLVKLQSVVAGEPSILASPEQGDDHWGRQQQWATASLNLPDKLCVPRQALWRFPENC